MAALRGAVGLGRAGSGVVKDLIVLAVECGGQRGKEKGQGQCQGLGPSTWEEGLA